MDLANLPDEFKRSKSKISKIDDRKELASGWGATTGGQALVTRYHDRLAEGFRCALLDAHSGQRSEAGLVVTLRGLSPELLALCSIQTLLHAIARKMMLVETLKSLGTAIANECWAAKLTEDHPQIAHRIAKAVTQRHSSVDRRVDAMKAKVEKAIIAGKIRKSFKARRWSGEALVTAGGWLWNVISTTLPEVFERVTEHKGALILYSVTLSEGAEGIVSSALDRAMVSNPVYWPDAVSPKPWTGWTDGGSCDDRVNSSVLRTHHKGTQVAVKHAIKTGQMQPALDALNALQAVPYKINTRVLEVIEACDAQGIVVKGMVPRRLKRTPKPNAFAWEAMSPAQQGLFHKKNSDVDKANRGFIGDRLLFDEDMRVAYAMLGHRRFYTSMNCDWRGRVYGLPHFNFQREDRVRALFLFADGEPIGTEGLWWLQVHTANCGDFGKISKRPLEERVAWCRQNGPMITNIASDPLVHTEWMGADKPFLFLAACFELSAALEQGSSYITQLPVSFDGSCSGLQHLCAMTRAAEGSMVNLTPSPLPQDVYQTIADDTFEAITRDLNHEPDQEAKDPEAEAKASKDIRELARLFLGNNGDRRAWVKRNVMTYAYSSKKFGMSSQQQVDLMEPLAREVLEGKLEEHPFEGYQHGPYDKNGNQQPSKAARYFAGHIFEAIETRIHKPAEAMGFLQDIAKAVAHEGKPVTWTTPVGIPWINRYHEVDIQRVALFLNDGGVKLRTQISVATGDKKEIDKAKSSNGVAPNFVHALDGSHLMLGANAAVAEGITSIATVHDSFGCLASQATRFNAIIREQFALMYSTHDVLTEILEQASCDLTPANRNRLPTRPLNGPLDLSEILNAAFAFA